MKLTTNATNGQNQVHPILGNILSELELLIESGASVEAVARYFAKDELVIALFYFREKSQNTEGGILELEASEFTEVEYV
jgi:hypothetical protein